MMKQNVNLVLHDSEQTPDINIYSIYSVSKHEFFYALGIKRFILKKEMNAVCYLPKPPFNTHFSRVVGRIFNRYKGKNDYGKL